MSGKDRERIINLQGQVRVARAALNIIAEGGDRRSPHFIALDALEDMARLDPPSPLQGLVGHRDGRKTT